MKISIETPSRAPERAWTLYPDAVPRVGEGIEVHGEGWFRVVSVWHPADGSVRVLCEPTDPPPPRP